MVGLPSFCSQCSTPFGISDPFTPRPGKHCRQKGPCAQRLSASQIHSHLINITLLLSLECSTPFGISDPFTLHLTSSMFIASLCSTPFGISDPFTRSDIALRMVVEI